MCWSSSIPISSASGSRPRSSSAAGSWAMRRGGARVILPHPRLPWAGYPAKTLPRTTSAPTPQPGTGGLMADLMIPDRSRFLQGPFAPVTEEITAVDLPVTGRLPTELSGRYVRNGPNPLGLDEPVQHWFVGPGMVHGVRLRDGRAEWYRNRWVRSGQVADALGEAWPGRPR